MTTTAMDPRPKPVLASTRAELLRLRKWPAVWVIGTAWLLLDELFAYVLNYVSWSNGSNNFSNQGQTRAELLQSIMPATVPDTMIQGTPMFGGALLLVLGAVMAGNGHSWGTWKTVFTQGPSRTASVIGSLAALATVVVAVVAATVALNLTSSLVVAALASAPVIWPSVAALAQSFGIALLVLGTWTFGGFLLGTLVRGAALSVGLGLVWLLVIENLLRGAAVQLNWLASFTHLLPGTALGSLVGAITGAGGPNSAPGVLTTLSGTRALWTVVAYLVVLPLITVVLVRRRDVS